MSSLFLLIILALAINSKGCIRSRTTASGVHGPYPRVCNGQLIFEDDFDTLDFKRWQHELTLAGGGNWEFQWYTNNRSNSVTENGILKIKPTLTADQIGEAGLRSMMLDIHGGSPADYCTNAQFYGCSRTGTPSLVLNPIKSARIQTVNSFSFRYGRIVIRAKLPAGDWLFPAIWMLPRDNIYGSWVASGEIDIMESRGNRDLKLDGKNIGVQQVGSTLHWGPDATLDLYPNKTHFVASNPNGFDKAFHKYELIWDLNSIVFKIDNVTTGTVTPPLGGFWEWSGLNESIYDNPWNGGGKMAPFDQEFYIVINLAVGGIAFFPDNATNPTPKPWKNNSPTAATDFWDKKSDWLPTWNLKDSDDSHFQIDYIKVYAL